jgi:hypothetical protein
MPCVPSHGWSGSLTGSLWKRLDHFPTETDQTNRGSERQRDYCTFFYVRQNSWGAPIKTAVHPSVCLCACNNLRNDERIFIKSDKKEFYETLSRHLNFHCYCAILTTASHRDFLCYMLRNSRKTQQSGKRYIDVCNHVRVNPPLDCSAVARIREEHKLKHAIYFFSHDLLGDDMRR